MKSDGERREKRFRKGKNVSGRGREEARVKLEKDPIFLPFSSNHCETSEKSHFLS